MVNMSNMFTVKHNECIGFESRWKVKKLSTDTTTQTTEFSVSEKACSTLEHESKDVQTISTETETHKEVDMEKLAEWLNRIYPSVKKQIDNVNNSKVLKNYKLLDDNTDVTCKLIQQLKVNAINENGDKALSKISCAIWNYSGKCLAVSSNFKHKSWCYHPGQALIYPFSREEKLSENPKKRLATESCVTVLKFHPTNDDILAAGTFTGQVYIWNVSNDIDPLLCNLSVHEQAITQISWVNDAENSKNLNLATSSTDGLLKMWIFSNTEASLTPKIVFKIKPPIFGKLNHSTTVPISLTSKEDLGIICFNFSKHIPDLFIVALEGGLIARCSVLGSTKIKGPDKNIAFDPIFKYYQPHKGEIASVKFSLTHKDMFLTCGTDGEIRIYLIDQDDPAQIIFTKSGQNDLSFVPHEQKLLATCGQKGTLEVYNFMNGKAIDLVFNTKITKRNLTSLAINQKRENYVVIGNDIGDIQLWNVPWNILT
ncbi:WD repeat-containing protein 34-like [Sitophilus oryzae]|uniref:Dynein axonemal intermediate chain 4 n=1 Tax=Sitophilus oryzae TaxID=7048 RepID=A0A6J2Y433_SITOR|nr:WD repeat-containing protein 34-like [Sitophilus oryzae]